MEKQVELKDILNCGTFFFAFLASDNAAPGCFSFSFFLFFKHFALMTTLFVRHALIFLYRRPSKKKKISRLFVCLFFDQFT